MKKEPTGRNGLTFGAGWGGVEAVITGIIAAMGVVNVYIYHSGLIETMVSAEQMAQNPEAFAAAAEQVEALFTGPKWILILGAVERVFAVILHLSLSLIVLQAVIRKNVVWILPAIAWHTLVNAVAVFGSLQGWDVLLIEGFVGVAALISLGVVWLLKDSGAVETPVEIEEEGVISPTE